MEAQDTRAARMRDPQWQEWPETLRYLARETCDRISAGRPPEALNLLDQMIGDVNARRRTVAELANED